MFPSPSLPCQGSKWTALFMQASWWSWRTTCKWRGTAMRSEVLIDSGSVLEHESSDLGSTVLFEGRGLTCTHEMSLNLAIYHGGEALFGQNHAGVDTKKLYPHRPQIAWKRAGMCFWCLQRHPKRHLLRHLPPPHTTRSATPSMTPPRNNPGIIAITHP